MGYTKIFKISMVTILIQSQDDGSTLHTLRQLPPKILLSQMNESHFLFVPRHILFFKCKNYKIKPSPLFYFCSPSYKIVSFGLDFQN